LLDTDLGVSKEATGGYGGSTAQPGMKGKEPIYLVGDQVSLADIAWGCVLFKLKALGNEYLWEDYPKIEAYVDKILALPSI